VPLTLTEVRTRSATLEDVFVSLTDGICAMNNAHPLLQLILVRIREFIREPEAVFWAILFPIVLTAGLGIAFRNRPAEMLQVVTSSPTLARGLRQEPSLAVRSSPRKPPARR